MFLPGFKTTLLSLFAVTTVLSGTMSVHAATLATQLNPSQFVGGQMPLVGNRTLDNTGYVVCYSTFCSMNSSATKGAIWSAEYLTASQIASAKGVSRASMSFHPDVHIPASASSRTSDYTRSGYDRGHMAPWADSADPDCFTLSNIVPQNPDNNRHLWEGIETTTREMATRYGEAYVVSGPIYEGTSIRAINGVAVPTGLYKAVYIPKANVTGVYVVNNAPGYYWTHISVAQLTAKTHTDPFPGLPAAMKQMNTELPQPDVHGRHIPEGDTTQSSAASPVPASMETHQTGYEAAAHQFMKHALRSGWRNLMGH